MPRIRLGKKNLASFTGQRGKHQFKDGVSVEFIADADANYMGAIEIVFDADTGEQLGPGAQLRRARLRNRDKAGDPSSAVQKKVTPEVQVAPKVLAEVTYDFDIDSLNLLAEKEGINGVRGIASTYGVKGTSILGLIDALIAIKQTASVETGD